MKKLVIGIIGLSFVSSIAFATPVGYDAAREAHRQEMKDIKKKQREERQSGKSASSAASGQKTPGFWEKEGERSGLSHMGNPANAMGTLLKNLNPAPFFKEQQDRYNARKTGVQK